jgi:GTP-binding protein SAR1
MLNSFFDLVSRTVTHGLEWLGLFNRQATLIFLGLDNSGKTSLLYMLQSDKFTQTDSTYHPHTAEVTIGHITFTSFDLGGHKQARKTWREYAGNVDGLAFIVDAADPGRISEAKAELEKLLGMEELSEVPFVVFGNKVDKPTALSEEKFRRAIGLPNHVTYGKDDVPRYYSSIRPIEVFMTSVKARVGYQDGFEWLSKFIDEDQD